MSELLIKTAVSCQNAQAGPSSLANENQNHEDNIDSSEGESEEDADQRSMLKDRIL